MNTLLILSTEETKTNDTRLADLAVFLGAEARLIDVSHLRAFRTARLAWDRGTPVALAIHAASLAHLYQLEPFRKVLRDTLLTVPSVLVYGVSVRAHDEPLRWLVGGGLRGTDAADGAEFCEFPPDGKPFTRQMAGARFRRAKRLPTQAVLTLDTMAGEMIPLMTLDQRPTFVCAQKQRANVFISTVQDFPAPCEHVTHESDIEVVYDALLPLVVFVRSACAEFCWHGGWTGARLIIDDPLLRRNYGYLDFQRLLDSLQANRYAATVAYIPWNEGRTSKRMARFFLRAEERFSLCVHGCDHTNNEYGSLDERNLLYKSTLALARMRRHEARTGIGFERVMVFPQGRFSTASLSGLRSCNFLAAINSTRLAIDSDKVPPKLCELLLPAITRPYGFPVFGRHDATSEFPFLLDLFLGRPAFIVVHHEFFKSGFPTLEALVARLNGCEPRLSWGPLRETVERTCWKRLLRNGRWQVRFFTDQFKFTNESDQRLSFELLKEEEDPTVVASIHLNDRLVPTQMRADDIVVEVDLDPGETARVDLCTATRPSHIAAREGHLYAGKVLVRRALSEFRDEILARHPVMLASATRVVRALKVSSDSLP